MKNTIETIEEMREAFRNNELQKLTVESAKSLIGERIQTIYFGYRCQDGVDEFVIGDIIDEGDKAHTLCIIADDGRNTCIRHTPAYNLDGEFHCSDIDRTVFFRLAK